MHEQDSESLSAAVISAHPFEDLCFLCGPNYLRYLPFLLYLVSSLTRLLHGSQTRMASPLSALPTLYYTHAVAQGLGNIGRGMVKNLYEQGPDECKSITIYNRTASKAEAMQIGTVASSVTEAVSKSDIIFTCLGDDKAMMETITEALKSDVKGKLFVDCSTIHPDTTDKLDKMIQEAGAGLVAMPVFGARASTFADEGLSLIVRDSCNGRLRQPRLRSIWSSTPH